MINFYDKIPSSLTINNYTIDVLSLIIGILIGVILFSIINLLFFTLSKRNKINKPIVEKNQSINKFNKINNDKDLMDKILNNIRGLSKDFNNLGGDNV